MSSPLARSLLSRMVKNHQGLGERSLNAGWSRCLKECTSLLYTEVERLTLALRTIFEVAVGMERTKGFFPFIPSQIPWKSSVHWALNQWPTDGPKIT